MLDIVDLWSLIFKPLSISCLMYLSNRTKCYDQVETILESPHRWFSYVSLLSTTIEHRSLIFYFLAPSLVLLPCISHHRIKGRDQSLNLKVLKILDSLQGLNSHCYTLFPRFYEFLLDEALTISKPHYHSFSLVAHMRATIHSQSHIFDFLAPYFLGLAMNCSTNDRRLWPKAYS